MSYAEVKLTTNEASGVSEGYWKLNRNVFLSGENPVLNIMYAPCPTIKALPSEIS
jgi:hypothetical protein